jgi:NADPH:quinone reductase-like Zn-dependent oxidoreductase
MFGPANLSKALLSDDKSVLTAPLYPGMLSRIKPRLDQTLPIGNEGAGVVVAAGDSEQAQALMGKTVAVLTGASYTQYCCVPVQACIVHHDGTTPHAAASSFVNPLTALGMVETMRMEGHTALVHTAAASSLGIMLNKVCIKEGVALVNIVRKQEQVDLLTKLGAKFVVNSSSESFKKDLYKAIDATGFNTYGSVDNKQVYIYGGLDVSPTLLNRAFGMTWSVGGWLLMRFLGKLKPARVGELYKRVADEINTTFAIESTVELSFEEAMTPEVIEKYNAKTTGGKYILNPNKG